MNTKINWHRLFGLTLIDLFTHSNYHVELEKDLSLKKQFLDVVIIEKSSGEPIEQLPDGLEHLSIHNLLTYKSLRELLDQWALEELIGHYVNYRKQISSSLDHLLPVNEFQLYAVSTRYPQKLSHQLPFEPTQASGVYQLQFALHNLQLIVLSQISKSPQNAIWHLFSGQAQQFRYGHQHYHWHLPEEKIALNQLYELYQIEEVNMSYTWDDFKRDFTKEHLHLLKNDEILQRFSPEERLKGLAPDEHLKGLTPEMIKKYLSKLK